MKALTTLLMVFGLSLQVFAIKPKEKKVRTPNQVTEECVKFSGSSAKQTFIFLYPHTQSKSTSIKVETVGNEETDIITENIFCRAYTTDLDMSNYKDILNKMSKDKFQCGYFISSEGKLTSCSDQM
jgi:hypothetical protein